MASPSNNVTRMVSRGAVDIRVTVAVPAPVVGMDRAGLTMRDAPWGGGWGLSLGRVGAQHLLCGTRAPRGRVPAGEGIRLRHRRHPHVDAVADDGPTGVLGMAGAKARDRDVASEWDDTWIDGARARVHVGAGGGVAAQHVAGHEELCRGVRARGDLRRGDRRSQGRCDRQTNDAYRHAFSFPGTTTRVVTRCDVCATPTDIASGRVVLRHRSDCAPIY